MGRRWGDDRIVAMKARATRWLSLEKMSSVAAGLRGSEEFDVPVLEQHVLAQAAVIVALTVGKFVAGASAMRAKFLRPRFFVGQIRRFQDSRGNSRSCRPSAGRLRMVAAWPSEFLERGDAEVTLRGRANRDTAPAAAR